MAHLIPWSDRFVYEKIERIDTSAGRVYSLPKNVHVPSVTTILDRTKDKALLKLAKRASRDGLLIITPGTAAGRLDAQ